MRLVPTADIKPGRCAVLPQVGGQHPEGYIDTGSEMLGGGDGRFDQHVYVSVVAARELAGVIGWIDPSTLEVLVAEQAQRIAALDAELTEANRQLDAIDALESAGYRSRKKPGRKPAREEQPV